MTNGRINFRPGGFVRGHGNSAGPPRRPAEASRSTLLEQQPINLQRFVLDAPACTPPRTVALRFTDAGAYLHVEPDGSLGAHVSSCADEASCAFEIETPPGQDGWLAIRSRMTGRLVRMVDASHVPFRSWLGIHGAPARKKADAKLKAQREAAQRLRQHPGAATCPLRAKAPPGWRYNATRYAPLIDRALSLWCA